MQIFEDLNKAIKERYEMIERAVEAERKSQHMSRVFTERMEEMVQARSEEQAQEEAEAAEAEAATAAVEVVEEAPPEEAPEPEEVDEAPQEEETPPENWGDGEDPWASE
jgi:hypothetical protein